MDKPDRATHDHDHDDLMDGGGDDVRHILRTFQDILEIMPDDRGALHAAAQAADQCGEDEEALGYRLRLGEVLTAEGDEELLAELAEELRGHSDPRAQAWVTAYDEKRRTAYTPPPDVDLSDRAEADLTAEMDLAWRLFDEGELSQEDYNVLVGELTRISESGRSDEPVALLHALEATNNRRLDDTLAHLSLSFRMPYVSLSGFTMRAELQPFLPLNFIMRRGALVFDTLSTELLVAILNPLNEQLRQDVEQQTGRDCHFYLTRASEFTAAFEQLKQSTESVE